MQRLVLLICIQRSKKTLIQLIKLRMLFILLQRIPHHFGQITHRVLFRIHQSVGNGDPKIAKLKPTCTLYLPVIGKLIFFDFNFELIVYFDGLDKVVFGLIDYCEHFPSQSQ